MKSVAASLSAALALSVVVHAEVPPSAPLRLDTGTPGAHGQLVMFHLLPPLVAGPSAAIGVNARGDVVGWSMAVSGEMHAVLWEATGEWADGGPWIARDLGTLGGNQSTAWYVNDARQVAGTSRIATGETHAFFWDGSTGLVDATSVAGYGYCSPAGMDAAGQVVGVCEKEFLAGSAEDFGFSWSPASGLLRLDAPGGGRVQVYGISPAGLVTGAIQAGGGSHAMRWSLGAGLQDLGAPFGGYWAAGFAVNDHGQVVGTSTSHTWHFAASWSPDGYATNLWPSDREWAAAYAISERGQVLGTFTDRTRTSAPQHAVLWSADVFPFVELADLGPHGPVALNERGQVLLSDGIWTDECLFRPLDGLTGTRINDRGQIPVTDGSLAGLLTLPPLAAGAWDSALMAKVKCLSRLRQLPKTEQSVLLERIKAASALAAQGTNADACLELDAFVDVVQQLVADGVLQPRQGEELVRAAMDAARQVCP